MMIRGVYRLCSNTPRFLLYIMSKYKIGDKVRIVNRNNVYFNRHATIIGIDHDTLPRNLPYLCEIKIGENDSLKYWCGEYDLGLLKNPKNYFTISLKKHKRINLKFAL